MWRLIETGDFRVDAEALRVSVRNRSVHLTPKEFKLLLHFAKRPTHIVTHHKLILAVWGQDTGVERDRLRVLVQQLRKKIENGDGLQYIVTEHWTGYRFEPFGQSPSREMQCLNAELQV
jgi:two-component system KDP operon response regulator KdpE